MSARRRASPKPKEPRPPRTAPKKNHPPFRPSCEISDPRGGKPKPKAKAKANANAALRVREVESLRAELEAKRSELAPRWNADPEDVQRSVAQLVLALVEFLRKLLERQAIRRMEGETLAPDEVERVGLALMRLEETVHDMARQFGLDPEDLNLDLGPLGRLH